MSYKLEAVNKMLSYIGESSVSSLDNTSGNLDVSLALNMLEAKNDSVQEEGWWFNIETRILTPDDDGYIDLPADMYRVRPTGYNHYDKFIERQDKLYDKSRNSFYFTESVEVEIVLKLDFENIPKAARKYIELDSTLEFIAATSGDSLQYKHIERAAAIAKNNLEQADEVDIDNNILQTNYQFNRRYRI